MIELGMLVIVFIVLSCKAGIDHVNLDREQVRRSWKETE
jgi:hypothetical protein